MPKVSVLVSVYNGEEYLEEALDSIREQTFQDWECVVLDDCSTDGTWQILERYAAQDPRFRIRRNQKNLRLPGSLNEGLKLVRGEYVMRADADDVCRPDRMEVQLAFMKQHPEVDVAFSKLFEWRGNEVIPISPARRADSRQIAAQYLFFNPFSHAGIMAKTEVLQTFHYNPQISFAEDLDLWTRLVEAGKCLAVQNEYTMLYRLYENQVCAKYSKVQLEQYQKIITRFYRNCLWELSDEEVSFLTEQIYTRNPIDPSVLKAFLNKILTVNRQKGFFDERAIRYGAFELYVLRRKLFLNRREWLSGLLSLGPFFVLTETVKRASMKKRANRKIIEAAQKFKLEIKESNGKKRFYRNV